DNRITASSLANSGRVQGESGLTLTLLNALTNQTSGGPVIYCGNLI
ncbi:hypothetical protein JET53_20825, partial [Escherichia coli]|nr:hypothetical protein [Escherichia coli]